MIFLLLWAVGTAALVALASLVYGAVWLVLRIARRLELELELER